MQMLILFIGILHHGKALEEDAAINEDSRVTEESLARLSWHVREQLLQVVEQLGHITGMSRYNHSGVPIAKDKVDVQLGLTSFIKRFHQ